MLSNVSIGTRIKILSGSILILMVIITWYAMRQMTRIEESTVSISRELAPLMKRVRNTTVDFNAQHDSLHRLAEMAAEHGNLASESERFIDERDEYYARQDRIDAKLRSANTIIAGLWQKSKSPEAVDVNNSFAILESAAHEYGTRAKNLMLQIENGLHEGLQVALADADEQYILLETESSRFFGKVLNYSTYASATGDGTEKSNVIISSLMHMAYISIVCVFLGIILMVFVTRSITQPLGMALDYARQIAGGRRDSGFPDTGSDEVGHLFRALNEMLAAMSATEKDLESSRENFHKLVEGNPVGIVVTNTSGSELFINTAATMYLGDRRAIVLKDLVEKHSGDVVSEEIPIICGDDSKGTGETRVFETQWQGQDAVFITIIDISDLKQAQESLRSREIELQHAQKMEAVGRIAGGVAHDFNNLLTVILGHSDILMDHLQGNEVLQSELVEIKRASGRAVELTSQLLAFSRRQVMQAKVLNLNTVVSGIDNLLRRVIGEDIELVTVFGTDLEHVRADPGQIEQVIVNLVVNARDAMPDGGKIIIETANVYLDQSYSKRHDRLSPGPYCMLAVSDTGCGMTEDVASQIFEPFFTTKANGKGTGLGLSTVYGIIKQSDGDVLPYSEPGVGTSFKIYLPQVFEPTEEVAQIAPVSTKNLNGDETILLVEDEEIVRNLVFSVLKQRGYVVLEASNGEEAVQIFEQHEGPLHLLLTDVVMPGMNGKKLADQLQAEKQDMNVLFISGYTNQVAVHMGLLRNKREFLQKPFTPDALLTKIREMCDNGGAVTEKSRQAAETGH